MTGAVKVSSLVALIALVAASITGCQTAQTVVRDNPERKMQAAEYLLAPIAFTPETIIVDARPRFDYSMVHIPRSVSLQWSDFTEPEPNQKGIIQNDVFAAARRLARAGIGPDTPVVVVGRGKHGDGEEGRVAWMLAYLGVKRVQFADLESFKARMTNSAETNAPPAVPVWKPETVESLNVTRAEVQFAMNKKATATPQSFTPGSAPVLYRIFDVRGGKDYLGHVGMGKQVEIPNMEAINIPWQEFFTKDLRPDPAIKQKLMGIGITPEQRILVIDQAGVSSAAVTMALRALGYSRAGNYAGGLVDLMAGYKGR
jgi:thiosulfate/3-mercaptopyruvate sulfurtransferase